MVDAFIHDSQDWATELESLRRILLTCGLDETFKWRIPCYTFQGSNLVNLNRQKACCVLGFFQGALLNDPEGILQKPGKNSRAVRVIRFKSCDEILPLESTLRAYVKESIELAKMGARIDFAKDRQLQIPSELRTKFEASPKFRQAFEALTPGRQRGYLLHFSDAKQSKTRTTRIERNEARILSGKGLHDCVCGLSKKLPACDGSHQFAT